MLQNMLRRGFVILEDFMHISRGQEGRKARLAFYFLLIGGLTFLTYIPITAYLQHWSMFTGLAIGAVGCLVGIFYIHRKRVAEAAIIAITTGFITVNLNTVFIGGVFSIGDLFLIPTTIIAWLIFGHRVGLRLAYLSFVCTILHLAYFLVKGSSFSLPLEPGSVYHAWLVTAFKGSLQLIIFSLIFLFSYFMNKAFTEVETLHANISAILRTDVEAAIAIFDADYRVIEGASSQHFRKLFESKDLLAVLDACELENPAVVRDIVDIVHKRDELTWSLNSGNLPKTGRIMGKRHMIEWRPIFRRDVLDRIIFVAHSVEDLLQAQATADKQAEEAMRLLQLVSLGSNRVIDFVERGKIQIREAQRYCSIKDTRHALIALHTLKGSARILGFVSLSEKVHDLESKSQDLTESDFTDALAELHKIEQSSIALGYSNDSLIISRRQAQQAISESRGQDYLLELTYPTIEEIVLSYQTDLAKLASSLSRSTPQLQLFKSKDAHHISHAAKNSLNQSLVHIFRNALDHGIESPEERARLGKPATPTVAVHIMDLNESIEVSFRDDGQGLDLSKIREKASRLGYETEGMNSQDLAAIVFEPGFSTTDSVSSISGRGIGMDAIRAAMENIGGQARIRLAEEGRDLCPWDLVLTIPLQQCIFPRASEQV
jgi:signal transduction histidine kinase